MQPQSEEVQYIDATVTYKEKIHMVAKHLPNKKTTRTTTTFERQSIRRKGASNGHDETQSWQQGVHGD
jgi:hypothetical protein